MHGLSCSRQVSASHAYVSYHEMVVGPTWLQLWSTSTSLNVRDCCIDQVIGAHQRCSAAQVFPGGRFCIGQLGLQRTDSLLFNNNASHRGMTVWLFNNIASRRGMTLWLFNNIALGAVLLDGL